MTHFCFFLSPREKCCVDVVVLVTPEHHSCAHPDTLGDSPQMHMSCVGRAKSSFQSSFGIQHPKTYTCRTERVSLSVHHNHLLCLVVGLQSVWSPRPPPLWDGSRWVWVCWGIISRASGKMTWRDPGAPGAEVCVPYVHGRVPGYREGNKQEDCINLWSAGEGRARAGRAGWRDTP